MVEGKCEICSNPARYKIFKTYPDGTKKWIRVCVNCEGIMGMENLKRGEDAKTNKV